MARPPLATPTPNPSPQGGGEEFAALSPRKLAPVEASPTPTLPHKGGGSRSGSATRNIAPIRQGKVKPCFWRSPPNDGEA